MSALAIEINDAGLAVASGERVIAIEPGFALVERERILTGSEAWAQARLKPRRVSSRYWADLSLEPGSAGAELDKSAAELAHAQLASLWRRFGTGIDDVVLVVPGNYRAEQLGLLLGLAQECGMPVRAFVDAAAASSVRPYADRQLMYVDASLYRVAATLLDQTAEAAVRDERALAQTGLAGVADAFTRRLAESFVAATRFDPLHHAETEQQLYDRLPGWLAAVPDFGPVELTLEYGGEEFRVAVEREALLGVAAGFCRAVSQLIAQSREPGRGGLVVQLSDRLAAVPGLLAELARLDDAHIERLDAGHAAQSALLAPAALKRSGDVKLLKRLPWRAPAAALPASAASPAPAAEAGAPKREPPTHVVYRGIAYGVDGRGIVVGREPAQGQRTIVVDDQSGGVSRVHCEVVLRDGELRLKDSSRYGTFVNEKRIAGETVLRGADVIRVGSPGALLQVVSVEAG
jgi:FHA domain